MTPPDARPVCIELSDEERAELETLRDLRHLVIGFGGDDFTVMPWIDAHRLHADEPYIGCPFCHPRFVERKVTDDMLERALATFTNGLVPWSDEPERMRLALAAALGQEGRRDA